MDPRDNVLLAQVLHQRPKGAPLEASVRAACGRAYYAAFVVVRDALQDAKFVFDYSDKDHQRAITLLKVSGDTDVAAAAMLLDQLRATRNRADYRVGKSPNKGSPFDEKVSQKYILFASQVITSIEGAQKKDRRLFIPLTFS